MLVRSAKNIVLSALVVSSTRLLAQDQPSLTEQLLRDRPTFDRSQFQRSAESLARGDLLACRNRDRAMTQPRDITVEEFSRVLNGVWVNRNSRTVHGLVVPTDTVFYIDMKGDTGTAVLIDRNNLGRPVLTAPFEPGGQFAKQRPSRPSFMAQVSCVYDFVDHYVKVSDELLLPVLTETTRLSLPIGAFTPTGNSLKEIWTKLVEAGYFKYLDMPTETRLGPTVRVTPQLGDKTRIAILPEGQTVTEGEIESGRAPGAEYYLPMLTGGYFEITLKSIKRRVGPDDRELQGVAMRWDAEYRGTGIASTPGAAVAGVEEGDFFGEGSGTAFLCAPGGGRPWMTSSCGEKNGLTTTVNQVGGPSPTTRTNLTPEFVFERFVIGRP